MLEIHLTEGVSFLSISCLSRSYTRTCRCVATKKSGLLGWKATLSMRPLLLEKGEPEERFDDWWSSTARDAPSGATLAR